MPLTDAAPHGLPSLGSPGRPRRSRRRSFAVALAATTFAASAATLTAGLVSNAANAAPPFLACNADSLRASQRYWFFGNGAGIDFGASGTTATALPSTGRNATEGTTVITDRDGQLLFWSNGLTVFNRNHDVMPNGSGLTGAPSATQTVAAFPALGQPGVYFVVSNGGAAETGGAGPLRYNVVDMSLDGGLGDVTSKNNLLAGGNIASEGLTAVPNADGTGFWVISATVNNPNIVAWEFDGTGPVAGPVASPMSTNNGNVFGTFNFSADLSQLVQMTGTNGGGQIRLLDFDATTGVVTERATWSVPGPGGATGDDGYSADFSPSGDYVYATKIFTTGHLYRYHIAGAGDDPVAIKATEENLGAIGGNGGQVHRAPDGRMYVARQNSGAIGVVNDPDNATDPDFVPNGFPLVAGTSSVWGLSQTITGCSPPPIELDVTADVATASVGDTITFTFTVHNGGTDPVDTLQVSAPLTGLGTIGCDTTTIVGGGDATCTATYVVTAADYTAGAVTLEGIATAIPDGGDESDRVSTDPDTVVVNVIDEEDPVVTIDGPTEGATYPEGGTPPADFGCTDLDIASCTAVDENGNPINPGDPIPSTPGTHTITVTGTDASGNTTTRTVTYTVVALPPPCPEDGLQVLEPPISSIPLGSANAINIDGNGLASGTVHQHVEPLIEQLLDPLTLALLGLDTQELVHEINCEIVEPVEDLVDAITIPVVTEVKSILHGLFLGLGL